MRFKGITTFLDSQINTSQNTGKSYRIVKCLDDTVSYQVMADDLNMDFSDCDKFDQIECVFELYFGNNYQSLKMISYEKI